MNNCSDIVKDLLCKWNNFTQSIDFNNDEEKEIKSKIDEFIKKNINSLKKLSKSERWTLTYLITQHTCINKLEMT